MFSPIPWGIFHFLGDILEAHMFLILMKCNTSAFVIAAYTFGDISIGFVFKLVN